MEYRNIPYVNRAASRLILGTASPSFTCGGDNSRLLDAAMDMGINVIDTARNYGLAERAIGDWLSHRQCRDKVIILSKCAHPNLLGRKRVTEKDIRKDFEKSSHLLGTDYIDIYLLHRDDPDADVGMCIEVLNAMHEEGKIGAFGTSNWTHQRIAEANQYAQIHDLIPFSVSSPHFSLARQQQDPWGGGCVSITGAENACARKWYAENQMPVIAYSSLGRGILSGKVKSSDVHQAENVLDAVAMKGYGCSDNFSRLARCEELAAQKNCTVAQLAMAWVYCQQMNTFAVATMSNEARLRENLMALSVKLTEEEAAYLNLDQEVI